jgi:hypothetical protein
MSEYDLEPVRGLPGHLPPGEQIIWQGAPDWRAMAKSALHIRLVALYFIALALATLLGGDAGSAAGIIMLGSGAIALFAVFLWAVQRTSVYTLTNRRLVLRIGVALNKCINIPLSEIASADLRVQASGHGDIVLTLQGPPRLGYLMLWPHARALRIVRPQPMLRAVPDAAAIAAMLYDATRAVQAVAPAPTKAPERRREPLAGSRQGVPA